MLKNNRESTNSLGLVADVNAFEAAIVRTRNNLTQHTARLEASPCRVDNTLTLPVVITNLTGHKFPTGYPSRRAWLHVKVEDAQGATVFESGAYDASGQIVGHDAGYEPHYDAITQPGQVQIYEAVMGDVHGQLTHRLMHAAAYLKDNRLLPAGMSPATTDPDIRVVGIGGDASFIGGSDRVTYSINTAGRTGPFKVSVELVYQSVPPRHVASLDSFVTSQISTFKGLYAAADKTPERVASVTLNVP
jgi:hypothetical protein